MLLSYVSLRTIFTKPSKKSKTVLTCPRVFKYSLSAVIFSAYCTKCTPAAMSKPEVFRKRRIFFLSQHRDLIIVM